MAKSLLLTPKITINGVDFTSHASSVEVSLKRATVDSTNFAGGGKEAMLGLKSDQFVVQLQQDFDAGSVNAVLSPLYASGAEFPVEVIPDGTQPVSATNPRLTGTCILPEYQILSGKVGDLSDTKVTFPTQRTGITVSSS